MSFLHELSLFFLNFQFRTFMYILSTAYLCFHVKATLFETVYLFMVGSVPLNYFTTLSTSRTISQKLYLNLVSKIRLSSHNLAVETCLIKQNPQKSEKWLYCYSNCMWKMMYSILHVFYRDMYFL